MSQDPMSQGKRFALSIASFALTYLVFALCGPNALIWRFLSRGPSYYIYYAVMFVVLTGSIMFFRSRANLPVAALVGFAAGIFGLLLSTLGLPSGLERFQFTLIRFGSTLVNSVLFAAVSLSWLFGIGVAIFWNLMRERRMRGLTLLLAASGVTAGVVIASGLMPHF